MLHALAFFLSPKSLRAATACPATYFSSLSLSQRKPKPKLAESALECEREGGRVDILREDRTAA